MVGLFVGSRWIPGRTVLGSPIGGGAPQHYRCNGLALFVLCVAATLVVLVLAPRYAAYPARHGPALFVVANVFSFAAAAALYAVGRGSTEVRTDGARWWRGLRDFFQGTQLNPHLWQVDLKMFAYRPSLIGLFLFNTSYAATQWVEAGHVSGRMALYQVLFFVYVANYFQFEYGMVHTWDVIAERFGWMLVWGDLVLVPFFYSLPGRYLVDMRAPLPMGEAVVSVALFLCGFWMFRGANEQKHRFRSDARSRIWGRPAESLDGRLLVSGFWGIGRKLNYTGELLVYTSWTILCGADSLSPYAVVLWLAVLFTHRAHRDDKRCRGKYGELWERYCRKARFRMVPFLY
ncbi:DUF1295 domain-containing protein [Streptomyces mirabilis]|nr:DUF1295 domain-containing protein [Streptomyces mirabilis]